MSEPPEASTPLAPSPFFWSVYPLGHMLLRGVLRAFAPCWRVSGRENIPARGAALFAPNHIADADPLLVGLSLRRPGWFMAKRELFEIRVLGPLISFAQAFPVERNGADRTALRCGEELLKNGQALVIFPEGQCAPDGKLQPLLPGATLLALRTRVPIIPVGIHGSNRIIPYGEVKPRRTREPVRVHFGAPLDFSDLRELASRAQREQSTQRLEEALRDAIEVARTTP
jgi:1-acyl-sn-glycerol-3-phosphate acyltransferase